MLCLLGMDEYRSELRAALEDLIVLLQESSSGGNRDLCCVRLEILAENALLVESIPLEITDVSKANFLRTASTTTHNILNLRDNIQRQC